MKINSLNDESIEFLLIFTVQKYSITLLEIQLVKKNREAEN